MIRCLFSGFFFIRGCCRGFVVGRESVEGWVVIVLDNGVYWFCLLQFKEKFFYGLNGVITVQIYCYFFNLRREIGYNRCFLDF